MKKIFLLLFTLFFIIPGYVFSQKDSSKNAKFIIKADILLPTIGIIEKSTYASLTFEKGFKKRNSIQLSGVYFYYNYNMANNSLSPYFARSRYETFQVISDYKYFLRKKKLYTGFFTGAYIKYTHLHQKDESYGDMPPYYQFHEERESSIAIGTLIGYQNYLFKRLTYEILLGFGYRRIIKAHIIDEIGTCGNLSNPNSSDLRMAINIGYKF